MSPYSNQIDNLLEEATRHQMTLREALAWLCAAEIARKDSSVFEMAMRMARFPCVRTLEGFEFEAQPSIDPGVIRELATCRWIGHGDNLVLLGPPGVGKTHLEVGPWGENRSAWATACCSARPLH